MQYRTASANTLYAKLYRKVNPASRKFVCYQLLADPYPDMTIRTAQHVALLDIPDGVDPESQEAEDLVMIAAQRIAARGNYRKITVLDPTLNYR